MLIIITNITKSPVTFRHLSGLLVDLEVNESMIVDGDSKVVDYYRPLETIGLSIITRTMLIKAFLNLDKNSKKETTKISDEKLIKVENKSMTPKKSTTTKASTVKTSTTKTSTKSKK